MSAQWHLLYTAGDRRAQSCRLTGWRQRLPDGTAGTPFLKEVCLPDSLLITVFVDVKITAVVFGHGHRVDKLCPATR